MKVRIELEGSPEELEASPFLQLLASQGVAVAIEGGGGHEKSSTSTTLPGVSEGLDERGIDGRVRELVDGFLIEVLGWEDVEPPEWGSPGPTPKADYIRLRRTPPAQRGPGRPPGAFVYVFPARAAVRLRLQASDLEDAVYAKARGVRAEDPYQVQIALHHEAMLQEALALARRAYDRAAEEVSERAARAS
jgi:hypothetical protein